MKYNNDNNGVLSTLYAKYFPGLSDILPSRNMSLRPGKYLAYDVDKTPLLSYYYTVEFFIQWEGVIDDMWPPNIFPYCSTGSQRFP